jgi:hypothetical protein
MTKATNGARVIVVAWADRARIGLCVAFAFLALLACSAARAGYDDLPEATDSVIVDRRGHALGDPSLSPEMRLHHMIEDMRSKMWNYKPPPQTDPVSRLGGPSITINPPPRRTILRELLLKDGQ